MTTIALNGREYDFEIALIRRGYGPLEISLSNVLTVHIINDSYEPFPRMTMTVKDPNSTLIPYFAADNNSKIVFTVMVQEQYGENQILVEKSHMFNIERVKPINFSGENNTYEITAASEELVKWLNPISFSTETTNVSTTTSACNLLAKANIPFIRPLKESAYRKFYITDINTPVRDHVQRLLDYASLGGNGFYYTWYDMFENKLRVESTKNIMNNTKFQSYNTITIPSGDFGSSDIYCAKSVHHTNDISATQINTISRGIKEFELDFDAGELVQNKMEYVDIVNGSTLRKLDPTIDNTTNIASDVNFTQMATGHEWYKKIRKAVRTYNTVRLTMEGTVQRNIGDLVMLKSSETQQQTFGGVWMTMRTVDTYNFGAGKFDQQLVVSRMGKV
jgi:hypothetical protein